MADDLEKMPLDARLLSYAIIELNISRRNVAIYPREHPSVERSLNQAFKFFKRLFEIRSEITLAIAKDIIIIDNYQLDKKNPVFREFALNLSKINIAYVTFKSGVTKDELYKFHSFLLQKADDWTVDSIKEVFKKYSLIHISVGFVDYGTFSFGEGNAVQKTNNIPLWERYIYGLLKGTLQTEEISEEVRDIPPEILARLLNKVSFHDLKAETYDKVITTYMKSSSDRVFSDQDLQRTLEFINHLRPDLKKQFLSSAVKTFSQDIDSAYLAFKKISVDEVLSFLDVINEQRIAIPQNLMGLIDRLSYTDQNDADTIYLEDDLTGDELSIPPEIACLFNEDNPETQIPLETPITEEYPQEIQSILDFDASELKTSHIMEFENEFKDDLIEKRFYQIILELMLSETVSEAEYRSFANIIKKQTEQLLWIGQYGQILDALKIIESNKTQNRFPDINAEAIQYYYSPEFISPLTESLRILGRQRRREVSMICLYYDAKIIPFLMDALIEEESQVVRRFLMDLLKQYGDKVIPEAVKRLADERWFVKRNMLYILSETDSKEVTDYIRPHCKHENLKVSVAAIKCLLNAGDIYAIEAIKEHLGSKIKDKVDQAAALSGSFRIKEVVGDLILLLNKTERTGSDLDKIPIIRAIGEIGDLQAVDAFRSLLSSRRFFFKRITDLLKEEIYKTLKNYPYESVKDLIEAGLKSKNEFIREESLRLSKGK
ncbi:MAG: HEAT repeat domain-containing protein [Nitrospirae bacterium]|jgi:hypothetical protein|nr:HEAT repeat domain-containing protein [Nitrospirota bacterium]